MSMVSNVVVSLPEPVLEVRSTPVLQTNFPVETENWERAEGWIVLRLDGT
jgi:hypothetical protein